MRTYDSTKVNVNVGALTLTGFADGTFVKINRNKAERYTKHVGAKGEVSRSKVTDNSGTIEVTLMHTSPCNAQLYLLENLPTSFPIAVIENGDAKFVAGATEAWIEKTPTPEFASEEGKCTWTFGCADLTFGQIK